MGNEVLQLRMVATDELVDRIGKAAVPSLSRMVADGKSSPEQLIQGLWAMFRLDALPENVLQQALEHSDSKVRVHAYRILANYNQLSERQYTAAIDDLYDADPHVQRAAAELLSRHPNQKALEKLVSLHTEVPAYDTHLQYTVLLAISHHLQKKEILQMAVNKEWVEKDSRVIALVLSDLNDPEVGDFLLAHLNKVSETKKNIAAFAEAIARTVHPSRMGDLLDWMKGKTSQTPDEAHLLAIATKNGMNQRAMKTPSSFQNWYSQLSENILREKTNSETLSDEEKAKIQFAIETAGQYKVASLSEELTQLLKNKTSEENVRIAASKALMQIEPKSSLNLIAGVMQNSEEEISLKVKLASSIGLWDNPEARKILTESLRNSPTELQEAISIELVKTSQGKSDLLAAIKNGYAPARLLKQRTVEENLLSNISEQQRSAFRGIDRKPDSCV
jgi:HEAT repeat protein